MCQRTFAIGGSRRQSVGSRSRPQHDANTDRRVSPGAASALLQAGQIYRMFFLSLFFQGRRVRDEVHENPQRCVLSL